MEPFHETCNQDVSNDFVINSYVPILFTNSVLKSFFKRGRGRVLNVGSLSSLLACPFASTYVSAKTALLAFHKNLQMEFEMMRASPNIQIHLSVPGVVDTPGAKSPVRRFGVASTEQITSNDLDFFGSSTHLTPFWEHRVYQLAGLVELLPYKWLASLYREGIESENPIPLVIKHEKFDFRLKKNKDEL